MEYIKEQFDETAFCQGEAACKKHYRLVSLGLRHASALPDNPHPIGSDKAGCWRLGFTFGLPI
ncbi:MAG: hypothetical protein ACHQ0Y_04960 [Thermodesulfovibrionales bacterium]